MIFRLLPMVMLLVAAAPSWADVERVGLVLAHHDGGDGLPKLRYAGRDAQRIIDTLTDVGSFRRDQLQLLTDPRAAEVREAMAELGRRIRQLHEEGHEVMAVLYYSGHAQNGDLMLGDDRLPMTALRDALERWPAEVRLAFIDSCGAGALTQSKGAAVVAPFLVEVEVGLSNRGQVIIASSSADEISQESDDIQGSFFTHHLATGLRGDADRDHDGRVTLDEAYAYAYGRTVAATAATRGGVQHPSFAYDLQGAGDVVLSTLTTAELVLEFPAALSGRYFVVDLDSQLFVAEFDKAKGDDSTISLPRGRYAVKKRLAEHLLLQRLPEQAKGRVVIVDEQMDQVAFADDYAKGTPIRPGDLGNLSRTSVAIGAIGHIAIDPGAAKFGGTLFAPLPMLSLSIRSSHLWQSPVAMVVDVDVGSLPTERVLSDGQRFDLQYSQAQVGTSLLWDVVTGSWRWSVGPRFAALLLWADFADKSLAIDSQYYFAFVPGLVAAVGWQFADVAHVELMARVGYLPYTVDEIRHVALVEAGLSLWWDL
jgi:Caspase domain